MDDYTNTHIKIDTLKKLKEIAEKKGLKLYFLLEEIIQFYFSHKENK